MLASQARSFPHLQGMMAPVPVASRCPCQMNCCPSCYTLRHKRARCHAGCVGPHKQRPTSAIRNPDRFKMARIKVLCFRVLRRGLSGEFLCQFYLRSCRTALGATAFQAASGLFPLQVIPNWPSAQVPKSGCSAGRASSFDSSLCSCSSSTRRDPPYC